MKKITVDESRRCPKFGSIENQIADLRCCIPILAKFRYRQKRKKGELPFSFVDFL